MCTCAEVQQIISPEINHDTSLFTSFYIVFTIFDSKTDQVVLQMRLIEDSLCFYTRLLFILSFKCFFFTVEVVSRGYIIVIMASYMQTNLEFEKVYKIFTRIFTKQLLVMYMYIGYSN